MHHSHILQHLLICGLCHIGFSFQKKLYVWISDHCPPKMLKPY